MSYNFVYVEGGTGNCASCDGYVPLARIWRRRGGGGRGIYGNVDSDVPLARVLESRVAVKEDEVCQESATQARMALES